MTNTSNPVTRWHVTVPIAWSAVLAVPLVLSGCATHYSPDAVASPYGFFSGFWHGIVFPYALAANILSWLLGLVDIHFLDSIQLIGRPNTGLFYYFGFVVGLSSYGTAGAAINPDTGLETMGAVHRAEDKPG